MYSSSFILLKPYSVLFASRLYFFLDKTLHDLKLLLKNTTFNKVVLILIKNQLRL